MIQRQSHSTIYVIDQQETLEFYGTEAIVKDNSGNWFSLTERKR